MGGLISALGRATSLLPSVKVTVPYRADRRIRLSVYADREVSYALNLYEPEVVEAFKALAEDATVVADVGAHMGIYSLLALARDCEVRSFEPHPDNAERVRHHVRANGFEAESTVVEAAVADEPGRSHLAAGESTTRHSLDPDGGDARTVAVATTTLDAHFDDESPDLVKVDVEGAGADVVAGAESILERGESVWIVEVHDDAERAAFRDAFGRNGFAVARLGHDHLLARPPGDGAATGTTPADERPVQPDPTEQGRPDGTPAEANAANGTGNEVRGTDTAHGR